MPGEQNVQFKIKTGKETEFNNLIEKKVLPILRKQNGFQEEVTFVSPKTRTASASGIIARTPRGPPGTVSRTERRLSSCDGWAAVS